MYILNNTLASDNEAELIYTFIFSHHIIWQHCTGTVKFWPSYSKLNLVRFLGRSVIFTA